MAAGEKVAADAREALVTEWVVDKHPAATIKDFQGFARVLLTASSASGIDYRLVMALIDKESGFNPRAVGSSGEVGLMQILPATAAIVSAGLGWDFVPPVKSRQGYASLGTLAEPGANVRIGLAYLKDQVARYGVTPTALRGYNRGEARAKDYRPHDVYAEDVAFRFLALAHRLPQ
mgnify:CR=1 FL=1